MQPPQPIVERRLDGGRPRRQKFDQFRRLLWRFLPILLLALGLLATGCGTVQFYTQAVRGQVQILARARPIPELLATGALDPEIRRRLVLAEEVRRFAKESLGLPADREFDRYSDLQRKYVSWVVFAAPEFSVEAKTWAYPLVGHLQYRGFFDKAAAEAEAGRWQDRGLDTYVGGVEAYSTLGWFRDPILNTFFHRSDAEFAELLFHELTHVRVFFPGDTDFNEALATAYSEAGVRRWLRARGAVAELAAYQAALDRDRQIVRLLLETREELRRLYGAPNQPIPALREKKAAVFTRLRDRYAALRAQWPGVSRYDRTFARPWNNARLNTVAAYYALVPCFARFLEARDEDPTAFFEGIEKLRPLAPPERRRHLEALAPRRQASE